MQSFRNALGNVKEVKEEEEPEEGGEGGEEDDDAVVVVSAALSTAAVSVAVAGAGGGEGVEGDDDCRNMANKSSSSIGVSDEVEDGRGRLFVVVEIVPIDESGETPSSTRVSSATAAAERRRGPRRIVVVVVVGTGRNTFESTTRGTMITLSIDAIPDARSTFQVC